MHPTYAVTSSNAINSMYIEFMAQARDRAGWRRPASEFSALVIVGLGVEAAADWDHLRTPETYLGHDRGRRSTPPDRAASDGPHAYQLPEHLRVNHWALAGEWTIRPEHVVLDQAGGS